MKCVTLKSNKEQEISSRSKASGDFSTGFDSIQSARDQRNEEKLEARTHHLTKAKSNQLVSQSKINTTISEMQLN